MKIIQVQVGKKTFRVKDCKGLSSVKGLMFDEMKNYDGALIYANRIWMPFVKKDLNLIFLDKDMKVIKSKIAVPVNSSRKSWKVYRDNRALYCLELKNTGLKIAKGTRIKVFE
jgi:uncharacterized membrane protein (UPF0127 family)